MARDEDFSTAKTRRIEGQNSAFDLKIVTLSSKLDSLFDSSLQDEEAGKPPIDHNFRELYLLVQESKTSSFAEF